MLWLQLDANPLGKAKTHKAVKSSLKGSKSQLSLEEVARAARKNANRRNVRAKATAILADLLLKWEQAQKARSCRVVE